MGKIPRNPRAWHASQWHFRHGWRIAFPWSSVGVYFDACRPPDKRKGLLGTHSAVNDINERILRTLGYSWLDERQLVGEWWRSEIIAPLRVELVEILKQEFGSHPLWAVKDPRLCRLLPLWLEVLEEIGCTPVFIVTTRDPRDVTESLWKRNGIRQWKAVLLWLRYTIDAEMGSRGWPRVCIDYEDLLCEWRALLPLVAQRLSLDWPVPFANAEPALAEFLDASLHHATGALDAAELTSDTVLADRAYAALRSDISHFSEMQPDLSMHLQQAVSRYQPGLARNRREPTED